MLCRKGTARFSLVCKRMCPTARRFVALVRVFLTSSSLHRKGTNLPSAVGVLKLKGCVVLSEYVKQCQTCLFQP